MNIGGLKFIDRLRQLTWAEHDPRFNYSHMRRD